MKKKTTTEKQRRANYRFEYSKQIHHILKYGEDEEKERIQKKQLKSVKTVYNFKNPTFGIVYEVDTTRKKHLVERIHLNSFCDSTWIEIEDLEPSLEFSKFHEHIENHYPSSNKKSIFEEELYQFIKNYKPKVVGRTGLILKNFQITKKDRIKARKELPSKKISDYDGSIIVVQLKVRKGIGKVKFIHGEGFPKWRGSYEINKVDMLKFLNEQSKKFKFNFDNKTK